MLRHLLIRDFVLVDRLELEFKAGFGTLTGETGAGKSILVDALAFVLGERGDAGLIRADRERAEINAEFDVHDAPAAAAWLQEHDLAGDDQQGLLLRRVLERSGRSRAQVNGSPVTLQQLREVSEALVDIHGQHAHQSLLRGDAQRALLDAHARLLPLAGEVAAAWQSWREASRQLEAAATGAEALAAEHEQLAWQVRELTTLGYDDDEWENVNVEHKRLAHAVALVEGARFALDVLAEGDAACATQLESVAGRLDGLAEYDPALGEVSTLLQSAHAELAEAVSALRRYADRVDLDPQRLGEIEQRIEAVLACARKFRAKPEQLPSLLEQWQARLEVLSESADLAALEARVNAAGQLYAKLAAQLSQGRAKAAAALGKDVSRVMQQLALAGGRFEIALLPLASGLKDGSAAGLEQIEFRIAGLSGSESRALAKVASGGELSRISLAIQVVTSQAAQVPTLVFDEVDVGIGGAVAEVIGRLLHELGGERQVLCVTHLPQVAARANWQWQVIKQTDGEQVRSQVVVLDDAARVEEIARMLGGVEITAITRQHAREILAIS
ncbi:MAG: DNA repair protein RecN [Propionivibrio sp.]